MTTITPFNPPPRSAFRFTPTLDGNIYTALVPWIFFGRRFYITLTAIDGTLICNIPLIGSSIGVSIQTLIWQHGFAVATTVAPHGYRALATIPLSIVGCAPDAYNGDVRAFATGPSTLSWPIAADPGDASLLGVVNFDINIVGGYFTTSKLVYRESLMQFEVSP